MYEALSSKYLEAIGLGAGEVQSEHVTVVDCAQHPTHFALLVILVVRLRPSVRSPPNFEGVVILLYISVTKI